MSPTSPSSVPVVSGIAAREVLDCRGLPTVQADVFVTGGPTGAEVMGRADVPSGRSTGVQCPWFSVCGSLDGWCGHSVRVGFP